MLSNGQAAATLAVKDIDRARGFYENTLGFKVAQESPAGILFEGGKGTAFFVYPSQFAGTNKATAMTFNVDDFDAEMADLRSKGITFLDFDYGEYKTENGVMQTPDGPGSWFEDPDGNIIALTHM